jgi:hypothetical protein
MADSKSKVGKQDRVPTKPKDEYDARYQGRRIDATPNEIREAEAAQDKIIERELRRKR